MFVGQADLELGRTPKHAAGELPNGVLKPASYIEEVEFTREVLGAGWEGQSTSPETINRRVC